MNRIAIASQNWFDIDAQLDKEGYALLSNLLEANQARSLIKLATESVPKGSWDTLDSIALGRGDIWTFPRPIPEPLASLRNAIYEKLVPTANRWADIMGTNILFPITLSESAHGSRASGEIGAPASMSYLREDDYQSLHQTGVGPAVFPIQAVVMLSDPDTDFTGGEFVMTEQRPRMQSRPIVVPLRQGDAALIAVAHRPFKGSKDYYRVNMKHAISRVRSGERVALEILFNHFSGESGRVS